MSIKCLFGHQWNGCKCERCGTTRDSNHQFLPYSHNKCFEKCTICFKERPMEHKWRGCKCERCGETRDEGHVWNGCVCTICGEFHHRWNEYGNCESCGKKFEYELTKNRDKISAVERVLKNHISINDKNFNIELLKKIISNLNNQSYKLTYNEAIAVLYSIDFTIYVASQLLETGECSSNTFIQNYYDLWTVGNDIKTTLKFSTSDMSKLMKREWGTSNVSFSLSIGNSEIPLKMIW